MVNVQDIAPKSSDGEDTCTNDIPPNLVDTHKSSSCSPVKPEGLYVLNIKKLTLLLESMLKKTNPPSLCESHLEHAYQTQDIWISHICSLDGHTYLQSYINHTKW